MGYVTQELDKITAKSNSLEQQNRKGGHIRTPLRNSYFGGFEFQQETSPVFYAGGTSTGLVSAAGGGGGDVFAKLPTSRWPPTNPG